MQMCKMQKCMVTCKPLPFLDIESFCLLDNPVLWHTRPIKVTPTWRSRFIPLNWDTHSVSLVWKRGWKWAKITTEFFFNQTVRKVVSYRDLALSQSTVTLIPCVMFWRAIVLNKKLNPSIRGTSTLLGQVKWALFEILKCDTAINSFSKACLVGVESGLSPLMTTSLRGWKASTSSDSFHLKR